MNIRILPVLGVALIAMSACSDTPAPTRTSDLAVPPATTAPAPAPATNTVITTENLARIGARIYLSPEDKDAILAEARMTEETFMALVEQLSLDAASAHRYAEALEVELTR